MLIVTPNIVLQEWEITEQFIRASGPGGQNVNKTSSAVVLRFEAARSPALSDPVKTRLRRIAGQKWTKDGAVILHVDTHRSQLQNREVARERLIEMIQKALHKPKRRVPTKPTRGSVERRLEAKKSRSKVKALRKMDME